MKHHAIAVLIVCGTLAATGCRVDREITSAEGDMLVLVEGNNAFALDLYGTVADDGGNLFFSPFSINAAFSMAYGGAEGETEAQLADALHVGEEDAWHDCLGALIQDLDGEKYRGYTLNVANGAWGQEGEPFVDDYVALLEDTYAAPFEGVDFDTDAAGITGDINRWVENETNGKIKDLFEPGDLSGDTHLVLANAIYFKADWVHQFRTNHTVDDTFYLPGGGTATVPLMHEEDRFDIAYDDDVLVLEMPYEDDELSMVVVLPVERDGLAEVEQALTVERLDGWLDAMESHTIEVIFPRFEMTLDFPLMESMVELGVTDAFDGSAADFSGIWQGGMSGVAIDKARHKAYVKVDEKGTEAAAATGLSFSDSAPPQPERFRADHPFLFLIRDRLTGTILFLGRVEDPRG